METITIGSAEAGNLMLDCAFEGTTNAASGGGDRITGQLEIVRTRASVDTVLSYQTLYVRNSGQGGATFGASTQIASFHESLAIQAQSGDVYTARVRYIAQENARTISHPADAVRNHLTIMRF